MKQIIGFNWSRSALGFTVAWFLMAVASAAYPPQWREAEGAPAAVSRTNLRGIAFGEGKFVAVPAYDGDLGKWTSATSANGITWTKGLPFPVQNQLHAVASNGSLFVGVGYGGMALTSTDGLDWTAGTSGVTEDLNAVAWGAGKFVAVGPRGKILTSTNGSTWMTTALPVAFGGLATDTVGFGNGQFVVPYGSSSILTSQDGLVWTKQSTGQSNRFGNPVYGNGLWVAGGGGSIFYSTNPDNGWVGRGMGAAIGRTAFVNGVFVAYGMQKVAGEVDQASVFSCTNPQAAWTPINSPLNAFTEINDIASNGSFFVAVGQNGRVIVSDAVTPPEVKTTLTVNATPPEAASLVTLSGSGTYTAGIQVPISASALSTDEEWAFKGWSDDSSLTNPSRSITVPAADRTYTAVYERVYPLIVLPAWWDFDGAPGSQHVTVKLIPEGMGTKKNRYFLGAGISIEVKPLKVTNFSNGKIIDLAFLGWGEYPNKRPFKIKVLSNPREVRIVGDSAENIYYPILGVFDFEAWVLWELVEQFFYRTSPANDGVASGSKYASNLPPDESAYELPPGGISGLPRFEQVPRTPAGAGARGPRDVDPAANGGWLQVEYLRRKDPRLHYTVEFSNDLIQWTPSNQTPSVTVVDNLWDRLVLKDDPAQAGAAVRYGRVRFNRSAGALTNISWASRGQSYVNDTIVNRSTSPLAFTARGDLAQPFLNASDSTISLNYGSYYAIAFRDFGSHIGAGTISFLLDGVVYTKDVTFPDPTMPSGVFASFDLPGGDAVTISATGQSADRIRIIADGPGLAGDGTPDAFYQFNYLPKVNAFPH